MDIAHRLKEIEEHVGRLSPVQKILLGTDGSVTQLLESFTGHPVSVRTREQEVVKPMLLPQNASALRRAMR